MFLLDFFFLSPKFNGICGGGAVVYQQFKRNLNLVLNSIHKIVISTLDNHGYLNGADYEIIWRYQSCFFPYNRRSAGL